MGRKGKKHGGGGKGEGDGGTKKVESQKTQPPAESGKATQPTQQQKIPQQQATNPQRPQQQQSQQQSGRGNEPQTPHQPQTQRQSQQQQQQPQQQQQRQPPQQQQRHPPQQQNPQQPQQQQWPRPQQQPMGRGATPWQQGQGMGRGQSFPQGAVPRSRVQASGSPTWPVQPQSRPPQQTPQQQAARPQQQMAGYQHPVQQQAVWPQPQHPPQQQASTPQQQFGSPVKPAWGTQAQSRENTQNQRSPMKQQPSSGIPPGSHSTSTPQTSSQQHLAASKSSDANIQQQMKGLSLGDNSSTSSAMVPKRKDKISKQKTGRRIEVETNHLDLKFKHSDEVYSRIIHYDVTIEPEKLRVKDKFFRRVFEEVRKIHFKDHYPAFDGKKNAYSIKPLPIKDVLNHTVKIKDEGRDRELTVKIKYTNTVDLTTLKQYMRNGESINAPQDAIQALDIVLRQPSAKKFYQLGRSYFTPPPGQVIDLGEGYNLWYGFFQSAIVGWKVYLNIDVAHKGFAAEDNCIDALRKVVKIDNLAPSSQLTNYQLLDFEAFIKKLYVVYERPPKQEKRKYRVEGLGPSAHNYMFEKNGEQISVFQHFQTELRYTIKYPNLPCLQCHPSKKIALPLELCRIAKEQHLRKMNEGQTRTMVRAAAVPPRERKQKIEASMMAVGFNDDPCIKEFGISVDSKFVKVPARILEPPTLEYGERNVEVSGGVWRSGRFQKPSILNRWAIYSVDQRKNPSELRYLSDKLKQSSRELGMQISDPMEVSVMANPRDLETDLKRLSNCQVVFVILPERGVITYAKVKKVAEINIGMLTQCIRSRTLQKLSPPTAVNILLKLNAKLNGVNHSIQGGWPSYLKRPVMVVGADVTHPAPGEQGPSIAAVAASHDPKAFCYNMIWKVQEARKEMIEDLDEIMKEQLLVFYRKTGYKPEAILFYRDGVSEGQFKSVIDVEVKAVQRGCKKLQASNYEPQITFLVVQKRHHTRLFPGPRDGDGKNRNVPAGTVVDENITHPTEVDFYLVSHASIQGTSRPTKYHLLWDDSNMTENELEEITYYLCHLFTRCTRSVSYPAPTYYAHLAAFRVRSYIDHTTTGSDRREVRTPALRREVNNVLSQNSPMYFV